MICLISVSGFDPGFDVLVRSDSSTVLQVTICTIIVSSSVSNGEYICNSKATGRYVTIEYYVAPQGLTNGLVLCDVHVFGVKANGKCISETYRLIN